MTNIHQQLSGNQNRRMANEARMLDRMERETIRREQAVDSLGYLMRNGSKVYYSYPVGGKYRESVNPYDLV